MSVLRPVFSLIAAVWFLQLAGGILGVLTPLGLEQMGLEPFGIGMIAGLHAAGFMAGAYMAPALIGQLGNIRVFAAAAALTAIGALTQGLFSSELAWAAARFTQGATFAAMFAAAEAWLGTATPQNHRGSVLGLYNVVARAALLTGPLIVAGAAVLDPRNYLWAGLCLAAALVPICMTRQEEPRRIAVGRLPLMKMIRCAPSAVFGVFMAGVVNSGTLALLPLYAQTNALAEGAVASAAIAYGIVNVGGLLSQWPAGRLSDRLDRRTVVAGLAWISAGAAAALFLGSAQLSTTATLALLFLWGAGSLSFYGICIAHGVDRADSDDVTNMMSTLLLVWAAGSVIGPIVAGRVMLGSLGPSGLFAMAAVCLFVLGLSMMVRRATNAPTPEADQEDWQPTMPGGLLGGELDPRT